MPLRLRITHDPALAHGIIVPCVIHHNLVVNTDDDPLDDNENANPKARHAARTGQAEMSQTRCASPSICSGERDW